MSRRAKLLGALGYAIAAGFVVFIAWLVLVQHLDAAIASRLTAYFAVFAGLCFGVVYGIGARYGSEHAETSETSE